MATANHPMTPELCRLFVALVDRKGSLAGVAEQFGEPTTNLSKQAKKLLEGDPPQMPRPWLTKRGQSFVPTDEGTAVLPAVREMVERWDALVAIVAAARGPGLTVACGQEAAAGPVLRAAGSFRRRCPDARFRLAVTRGRAWIEGLTVGLYDVALVTHAPQAIRDIARRDVAIHALAADDHGLACAAESPWAAAFGTSAEEVTADEIRAWPLVLPEVDSPIRRAWDELIGRRGTAPAVALEVGGWRVLRGYVRTGFGVGLLPKSLAAEVRWRPLPAALRPGNKLYAVTLSPPANAELAGAFVEAMA